ncbi:LOW QUALITY PROTEIN: hypothetical protein PHMEG_00024542 [Phytophthora megakarya]|uniref:Reverse transcriptase/retrotransposon-derived protein RNase H-like domain-containing protein n=1 Tax=Phytophthora megakarya TaxID=4795 RepID=A0A225VGS5_9STRA|nr:LOW QUALITY PROTEIN: hypothetical protein PHMEG_00024542 [Phytophthora megakarya]
MYLEKLNHLFRLMNEFGLKLSVKKSSLYLKSVKWCGKIIDGDGVRHDPERINSLREMPYPTTAANLQQFLCAANWLRGSIVGYAEAVKPLQEGLDDALRNKRKSKRAAAAIQVTLSDETRAAFDRVRDLLATSTTLHHPSPDGDMVLVTDASDKGWSIVVTQVEKWDSNGECEETHTRKLLRWALKLSEFRYTINHIAGTANVWADMLSRWACQPREITVRRVTTRISQQQKLCTLRPLDEENFVWPTWEEVLRVQRRYVPRALPPWLTTREDGLFMREDQALLRRLMIISHCGAQGHRGRHAMMSQLASVFSIDRLQVQVDAFIAYYACMLKVVKSFRGREVKHTAVKRGMKLYILIFCESFGNFQDRLALKDDASHFCELVACESPTSDVAVEAILQWHSRFGVPK